MERDFLGLRWKESSSQTLKQITTKTTVNDSVSGMQWWRSEYASESSEFQPFKATSQESSNLTSPVYANFDYNHNKDKTVPISNHYDQFHGGFPFVEWPSLSPTDPRNKSKQISEAPPPESRLTIIYDNDVYVFGDISPEKAEAIMRLAQERYYNSCFTAEDDMKQMEEQSTLLDNSTMPISFPATATTTPPLARRATLEHFMQKRKDRIIK